MQNTQSLKSNRDFRRIYARAKSLAHPLLVTYAMRNNIGVNRLGITTSKKIGNAVKRNRAKRIIRQAYAQAEPALRQGYDFVLVARTRTISAKSTDLLPIFLGHAKKLGLLEQQP